MNIVTSYFKVKRLHGSIFIGENSLKYKNERQEEYLFTLAANAGHPGVSRVVLLVEGMESYEHFREHVIFNRTRLFPPELTKKIIPLVRLNPLQPTYAELFYQANQILTDSLVMVCNADVYLSQTHFQLDDVAELFRFFDERKGKRKGEDINHSLALALTRHESEQVGDAPLIHEYRGSHDAFIVRAPVPMTFLGGVTHPQNCYQAENIVIYELQKANYLVLNPCLGLKIVHKHEADLRQWGASVDSSRYGRSNPIDLKTAKLKIAVA